MFRPLELFVGSRYLRLRRRTHFVAFISVVSMLGIMVGVATLIVVLSVMNGFESVFRSRILSVVSHATLEGIGGELTDWRRIRSTALAHPSVQGAAPYVEGQGMLLGARDFAGSLIRGVDPATDSEVADIARYMQAGEFGALEQGGYQILLGNELADRLGVSVGDRIVLMLAEGRVTPAGIMPRMRRFTVAGVFSFDMYEYDSRLAITHIGDAARLFRLGDTVSGMRLKLYDMFQAPTVVREVALDLGGGYYVSDWTRQHANFFRSIKLTKSIMFVMLLLVVAVAAFNIVSTLMMVVTDKQSDVAILRTIGASPGQVLRTFMFQGTLIGLLGTLLGLALGILLALNAGGIVAWLEGALGTTFLAADVYFISRLPTEIRDGDLAVICTTALALALVSTVYPAWRAARTRPADVLRYE